MRTHIPVHLLMKNTIRVWTTPHVLLCTTRSVKRLNMIMQSTHQQVCHQSSDWLEFTSDAVCAVGMSLCNVLHRPHPLLLCSLVTSYIAMLSPARIPAFAQVSLPKCCQCIQAEMLCKVLLYINLCAGFSDVLDGQALACPPPLNSANLNDADVLLDLFGEYVARCAYAPSWQHRQAAMRYISSQVDSGKMSEARQLVKFLVKGLRDKVAAVVMDTSKLMLQLVNKKGRAAPNIIQASFPVLVERLGDGNARVAVRAASSQPPKLSQHRPGPSCVSNPLTYCVCWHSRFSGTWSDSVAQNMVMKDVYCGGM